MVITTHSGLRIQCALERFKSLSYHNNPTLAANLKAFREWQGVRLKYTHIDLLSHPRYREASLFFIEELYSGDEFDQLTLDIERVIVKVERLLPGPVLAVLATAMELNALSSELDESLCSIAIQNSSRLSNERYIEAFRKQSRFEDREIQIQLLMELSLGLDKYVGSRMLYSTFKLAKRPAARAGLSRLYNFIERGFEVLRPVGSASEVVKRICEVESVLLKCVQNDERDYLIKAFPPHGHKDTPILAEM